jgi:hypothetical protein
VEVLDIDVSDTLAARWRAWLAPRVQPFWVSSSDGWPATRASAAIRPEAEDTYATWRLDASLEVLWIDETTFFELPRHRRAELVRAQVAHRRGAVPSVRRWSDLLDPEVLSVQADGHRFVWWPSLVARSPDVLTRVISRSPNGAASASLPSRHGEVAASTWQRCADVLPAARRLAGSFPEATGPNCFSNVLAAAGAASEAETVLRAPFLAWLASTCRPGGRDDDPGTVLLWRDAHGEPFHAAVTIGDGWALEKASGEWWTPRAVRGVRDVIRASRAPGLRLERHRIAVG